MSAVQTTPALFVAHIITGEAHALGDPEIIVMTDPAELGETPRIVAGYPFRSADGRGIILADFLADHGWRIPPGVDLTHIEPGYMIAGVERL